MSADCVSKALLQIFRSFSNMLVTMIDSRKNSQNHMSVFTFEANHGSQSCHLSTAAGVENPIHGKMVQVQRSSTQPGPPWIRFPTAAIVCLLFIFFMLFFVLDCSALISKAKWFTLSEDRWRNTSSEAHMVRRTIRSFSLTASCSSVEVKRLH